VATSHYCNGKWRTGAVAECSNHTRLDRKQTTVYDRSVESPKPSTSTSTESSGSSGNN
jgi:hypothetical protein